MTIDTGKKGKSENQLKCDKNAVKEVETVNKKLK
jgi:hypothetical protein